MFRKILVANRGEIAVRVVRACRELGIASAAVYSEADRRALHTRLADEAYCLGPAEASQSYLSIDKILDAARRSGADAVHPGYGFLAESADFAQAVTSAGLVFIGPSPEAVRAMGDKAEARRRVQAAGVPVTPGHEGLVDEDSIESAAQEIGYPLLLKAAAGGGGKGMRVVWEASALAEAAASARREAAHAFGDERLILERYIPHAHHVEFQVLGDRGGKLVHLFERECSVQRRHQKIIEETPSPSLDEELRREMGAASIRAARSVGYFNAGTVEFILDPETREFYFLEMNTRLQVEHPVTELTCGIDLVHWQIRIAAGEPIPFEQSEVSRRGHALECRLYAEDPQVGFLPAGGKLLNFVEPQGPGIRVDSGYTGGDEIPVHYDPLIAKLIVQAEDRPSAVRRMQSALEETVVLGIASNSRFLLDVLAHPDFHAGKVHTTWVEEVFGEWREPVCETPVEVLAAAALVRLQGNPDRQPAGSNTSIDRDPYSPWMGQGSRRTRFEALPTVQSEFQVSGKAHTVSAAAQGEQVHLVVDGQPLEVEILDHRLNRLDLRSQGKTHRIYYAAEGGKLWISSKGCTYLIEKPAPPSRRLKEASLADFLRAPMPAQVTAVDVQQGDRVEKGQTLLVLEAMKMEIRIQAPQAGVVSGVYAQMGDRVDRDQLLVELGQEGSDAR